MVQHATEDVCTDCNPRKSTVKELENLLTLYVKVSGCQLGSKCDSFYDVGFLYEAH